VQEAQKLQPHHFFQSGAVAHHFSVGGVGPRPMYAWWLPPRHSSVANQFGTYSLARWSGQVFYGCLVTSGISVGLLLLDASARACAPGTLERWGAAGPPSAGPAPEGRQSEAVAEKTDTAMLSPKKQTRVCCCPKNRHAYATAKKQTRLCYSPKNRHAYATVYARFGENVVSDREVATRAFIIACLFFV
jgi:hypothetical protein